MIKLPNKEDSYILEVLGGILTIVTLTAAWHLFYGAFFDRDNSYNRKALYIWIKNNELPLGKKSFGTYKWNIDGYEITLTDKPDWYVFKGNNIEICGFQADVFDKYRYKKILEILKAASLEIA